MQCKAIETCKKLDVAVGHCDFIGRTIDHSENVLSEIHELREINQRLISMQLCLNSIVLLLSEKG
jgi:hypothetical protein